MGDTPTPPHDQWEKEEDKGESDAATEQPSTKGNYIEPTKFLAQEPWGLSIFFAWKNSALGWKNIMEI